MAMGGIGKERALWLARQIMPHEPALRAWLRRRSTPFSDADDIIQEAYARLATLDSVDHILEPRAYLFRTANSIIAQEIRRARIVSIESMADLSQLVVEANTPSPEHLAAAREELNRVAEVIDALPAKCRTAFVLRKVHGLPQREIAQRMGVSEGTVEKHISRGIQQLMAIFARGGNGRVPTSIEQHSTEQQTHDKARKQRGH